MTRQIVINGRPVKVRIRQRDIDAVLNLCAHNPDAVRAYAAAQLAHLPARIAEHEGRHVQLAYSYARQAFAAEAALADVELVSAS